MVQTTSHIFSGKVDIESNLLVGSSHLFVDTINNRVGITTADPDASLHVNGNVYVESNVGVGSNIVLDGDTGIITATEFRGDGSNLVGVLTSLQNATEQGAESNVTIELTNDETSLIASGNVTVAGNVTAATFIGDGSQLTGIAANLQAITDNGNVTSNTVQFTNTGTSLTASGTIEAVAVQVNGLDVALDQDMSSNAERIGFLETDVSNLTPRVTNLETANAIQSNLITNLTTDLSSNAGRIADLITANGIQEILINDLRADMTSNVDRIADLITSNGIQASLISNLTTYLSSNVDRIADLEIANGIQSNLITDLTTDLSSNAGRIADLITANGIQAGLITNLTTDLSSNAGRIADLITANGIQAGLITNLTTDLSSNAGRIADLITANAIQSNLISDLTTDLSSNAGRIDDLITANGIQNTLITNLTTDLSSNAGRIDDLELATGGGNLTLQGISDLGNATTNVVRFTNTTTGFVSTANIEVGGNVKIDGLTAGAVPYVASDNFLKDSFISTTTDTTVITSNLDVTGNIFMRGERFIVESETKLINDAIIGIANNNTTATTDVGILMQRPTANVALIHHGGTDKFTIGYTQNNLTATDITNDTTNIINVNVLGELYVQNNIVLGSSGKYYGDGSTLTNVPTSTEHSALSTRVGDIETALGGNGPTFPDFNLDGVVDRGNTTSNTILLTNATTGIVATGNVEALKFIGDGTSLTGLTLQHITDLGNVTTSNIQAAYFKGDGSELENITLDNVVNKGNATSNVIHLSNATKGLEADGNIHASFFIGDGSELTNVTLDNVVNKGNTTSNTVQFTNTGTSLTASGNVAIDGNVSSTTALVSNVATMGTTKTFVVTASGGYFHIDGVDRPALELHEHQTYIFDVSSLSGSGHGFALSETVQGIHTSGPPAGIEYTDGVDHSVANKLILTVQTGAPDLYYYCTTSGHSSMGNTSPCKVYSTAELVVSGRVDVSGNVDVDSNINVLGNVYANSFVGNGAGLTNVPTVSTLQDVTTNGPSTSQAIQLTNTGTSLTASGGVTASYFTGDGGNVAIGVMTATTVPYVDSNKQLRDSHIKNAPDATIINSNLQVTGNLFVTGNTFAVNSENMLVNDRIIGIANNNVTTNLDMGLIMQYPNKNVAVIHHGTVSGSPHNGQLTIGYTQNNMTTNNITQDTTNDITLNVWGSVISSNYFGDGTTLTGVALSNATIISNSAGITSGFATGDLLYASANNVLNKLPISSTTGHVLKVSSAGIPEWAQETGGSGSGSSQWQGTTDIYFNGNVGISNTNPGHDLSVGTNFFVDDSGSNVVVVDGGVKATKYYGDGSALTGINATGGGQWTGTTEIYFDGNVGVANTNPGHDLSVGSNLFVDDDGSNVLVVDGNVSATYFIGDGSKLTGINATGGGGSSQWSNVTVDEVYFQGNVGISNTDPGHDLSVGSNFFVDDDGSNVLVISGNAAMTALTLGEVSIVTSYGLDDILSTSNISSNTIQLTEQTTGLVATGNVEAFKFIGNGSELTNISLEQVTNYGNITSNTIEFSNATTGLVTTANVEVGGALTVAGNATVSSNLTVSGNATVSSNLTVSGNVSDLNIVSNVNMLHTANTASIKLNSNVVTEFPRSKKLMKFPRVALTSAANNAYENGYKITTSSTTTWSGKYAFDGIVGSTSGSLWYTGELSDYTGTDGAAASTAPLLDTNTDRGQWLGIELPVAIKLQYFYIWQQPNDVQHFPKSGTIYAKKETNDPWVEIYRYDDRTRTHVPDVPEIFDDVNSEVAYKYFALVCTKRLSQNLSPPTGSGYGVAIGEWQLFGVPEYDPEAHGTDVVVKSEANVPNTDWLEVYHDAKDLADGAVSTTAGAITGLGGTTNNGTAYGNPQISNGAFVLDGTGDYILTPVNADLSNHTASMWIVFDNPSTWETVYYLGPASGLTGENNIVVHVHNDNYFRIESSGRSFDVDYYFVPGKWVHMTVLFRGALGLQDLEVYIDNVRLLPRGTSTNPTASYSITGSNNLIIGSTNGGGYPLEGKIANFRLFNRVLTTDEIYQLYAYQKEYFGHGDLSMTLKAGRLGIGTSEPRAALDVRGDVYSGCPVFWFASSTSTSGFLNYNQIHVNKGGGIQGDKFIAPISGYYHMTLHNTGNTGTSRTHRLEWFLNGVEIGFDGIFGLYAGTGSNAHYQNIAGSLIWYMNAGDYMQVQVHNSSMNGNLNGWSGFFLST